MSQFNDASAADPPATRPSPSGLGRHELHRSVDGDWSVPRPSAADRRASLVAGLAMVATLPVLGLLYARWPDTPRAIVAVLALLPLLTLVLAAVAWRPGAGRSSTTHPDRGQGS